jgi:hypothetical protein
MAKWVTYLEQMLPEHGDHAVHMVQEQDADITLSSGWEPLANSKARSWRMLTLEKVLALVAWVQRRNHRAYHAHRKRRETECYIK